MTVAADLLGLPDLPRPLTGPDLLPLRAGAEVAGKAYLGESELWSEARRLGFHDAKLLDEGSAQCAFLWRGPRPDGSALLVIAPRGTGGAGTGGRSGWWARFTGWFADAWKDFTSQIRVPWSKLPAGATVGLGFRSQAVALYPGVAKAVDEGLNAHGIDLRVFVVGHSLGGALAPILALAIKKSGRRVRYVVAVEAPRPGGQGFADAYRKAGVPTARVVNVRNGVVDLVPRLPPSGWPFNARHVGGEEDEVRLVMFAGGQIFENAADWEAVRAAHPVPRRRIFTRLARGIGAHSVEKVLASMDRLINGEKHAETHKP